MIAGLVALNRLQVKSLTPYLLLGVALWLALLSSGIHATLAGVILAMAVPSRTRINALEFSTEARAILDDFDRAETGDLLVLTSKGQQEALYALEVASTGVTMSLFVGSLAFGDGPMLDSAKVGILVASIMAGCDWLAAPAHGAGRPGRRRQRATADANAA